MKAERLFGEADSGVQHSMLTEVPDKEVIIKGKGKTVQVSMDDYMKLKENEKMADEQYAWERAGIDDEVAAKELYLWINNDGDLYRQQYTPCIKNLVGKKARGVYDREKAVQLFMYLVDNGAKRYNKEVGDGRLSIPSYFPKALRLAVARELRDNFEDEWEIGNYREYIPKKYIKVDKPKKTVKKKLVKRAKALPPELRRMRNK